VYDDVTALILAGGKATRMGGVDKRELVVGGQTIFERQLAALAGVAEVLVSSKRDIPGVRTVRDAVVNGGPLAGIAAGLAVARTPWVFVLAGDMPYVTAGLVARMLDARGDGDAVGIRIGELPEPLVCVLKVATYAPLVDARLARGDLKASRLLTDGRVTWLADVDRLLVRNVNAPDDL